MQRSQYIDVNGPTSPARNTTERVKVESRMEKWIVKNNNQAVIFGHTHRPIFPSHSTALSKERKSNKNNLHRFFC